jgi:hypothetical protein
MVWFYTRDQQSLTLETRYDNVTHEFVAVLTGLGGSPITKRFATAETFQEWIVSIERDLAAGQWAASGAPHILPDGWRDKP